MVARFERLAVSQRYSTLCSSVLSSSVHEYKRSSCDLCDMLRAGVIPDEPVLKQDAQLIKNVNSQTNEHTRCVYRPDLHTDASSMSATQVLFTSFHL